MHVSTYLTCFYFGLEQDWKSSGGWRVSFTAIQLTIREWQSQEGYLGRTNTSLHLLMTKTINRELMPYNYVDLYVL